MRSMVQGPAPAGALVERAEIDVPTEFLDDLLDALEDELSARLLAAGALVRAPVVQDDVLRLDYTRGARRGSVTLRPAAGPDPALTTIVAELREAP